MCCAFVTSCGYLLRRRSNSMRWRKLQRLAQRSGPRFDIVRARNHREEIALENWIFLAQKCGARRATSVRDDKSFRRPLSRWCRAGLLQHPTGMHRLKFEFAISWPDILSRLSTRSEVVQEICSLQRKDAADAVQGKSLCLPADVLCWNAVKQQDQRFIDRDENTK